MANNFTDKLPAQPALIYSVLIRDWIREPTEAIHKILTWKYSIPKICDGTSYYNQY